MLQITVFLIFFLKQVFTKEQDGKTQLTVPCEHHVCEQSDKGQKDIQRGLGTRGVFRREKDLSGKYSEESCDHAVTDRLMRELSWSRNNRTLALHFDSLALPLGQTTATVLGPFTQEVGASTLQSVLCFAGTYILLLQAKSAQNIIQCFPAIIGSTVQSSNDYIGVILSRNNTIHYGNTYFTFTAKAKLAGCFSCTYLSKKMNTSRFAYWFCVQRTAA